VRTDELLLRRVTVAYVTVTSCLPSTAAGAQTLSMAFRRFSRRAVRTALVPFGSYLEPTW
jgi:hypothetical protein